MAKEDTFRRFVGLDGRYEELMAAALRDRVVDGPELVQVGRADLIRVLEKYLDGEIGGEQLVDWAELIHGLDEVQVESGSESEDLILEFLFEASTPEIFEPISCEFALRWLGLLGGGRTSM
ncbi:hypothetical protein LO762_12620 [Actinocorallia sp. API 0066]|uniref:hypothetical protein n=1 Tax=Actinocorallia sp. API 0066 TaxID=2896846 RepID=UPI001E5D7FB5|nr:hypothetical protein [Actinocorallia sp. API 0066]MCD0450029.1 hypothetical protein [Actinocorallia sp. API 0066]